MSVERQFKLHVALQNITNHPTNNTNNFIKMVPGNLKCILAVSLVLMTSLASGFSTHHALPSRKTTTQLAVMEESTSLLVATESWRQYVFPIVTAGVLIDIVLGSPVANSVLKPLRGDAVDGSDQGKNQGSSSSMFGNNKSKFDQTKLKERIDSDQVAKAAVARAQNALELRRYLDNRKTDQDRMNEIKKQLDAGMQDFDSSYASNAKKLSEEMEKRGKSLE